MTGPLYAQATNSYQMNEAWGTGTMAGGVSGAIMHQQFGQQAGAVQRARCGQSLIASTNQSIGAQITINVTGNNNSVNGNTLTGTNTGDVTNNGINAGTKLQGGRGC
ncbi:MAG: hypothetical protein INF43_03730 [Alphaproteobacteria bacterium]|jgi:hypothetical protein|nr:hypothetical protein [Alphaproteobacteria bacterium]